MTKRADDTIIAAALRQLDPAPVGELTDEERQRADVTLARLLATPLPMPASEEPRRGRRGLVIVGLVGAAGAAVPALLLGGGSAFASWTATPEPLTSAETAEAATTCLAALEVPDQGERVMIAERRGGWTYVLLVGSGSEHVCLMPEGLVEQDDPAEHQNEGFMGSSADLDEVSSPVQGGIVETESGTTSVPSGGLWNLRTDEEWVSSVQGHVDSRVIGVTVHTSSGVDVEASVANGRFAAWWPSGGRDDSDPSPMATWTYTVTLTDGATRQVTG